MAAKILIASCALALAPAGCNNQQASGEQPQRPVEVLPPVERNGSPVAAQERQVFQPIEVDMAPKSDSSVQGTAVLQEVPQGVKIVVNLRQAPPGPHAIHIHEKADCSDPEAKSAGGHFAPEGRRHGFPTEAEHHLGDMGNLVVEKDGTSRFEFVIEGANLDPNDPKSLLGRAVVLHAEPDKGTQPAGDAGARIACGEITA